MKTLIYKWNVLRFFVLFNMLIGCGQDDTASTLFRVECFDSSENPVYGPTFVSTAIKSNPGTWELQGTNGEWTTVYGSCIVE